MRNKDGWLIVAVLVLALVLWGVYRQGWLGAAGNASQVEVPSGEAIAYVLVTVGDRQYDPVPLSEEKDFHIKQQNGAMENVLHVTRDGVTMASATCKGQDCVQQGTVTLENRAGRVLGNFIVCLPNQVTVELLSAQEAKAHKQ